MVVIRIIARKHRSSAPKAVIAHLTLLITVVTAGINPFI